MLTLHDAPGEPVLTALQAVSHMCFLQWHGEACKEANGALFVSREMVWGGERQCGCMCRAHGAPLQARPSSSKALKAKPAAPLVTHISFDHETRECNPFTGHKVCSLVPPAILQGAALWQCPAAASSLLSLRHSGVWPGFIYQACSCSEAMHRPAGWGMLQLLIASIVLTSRQQLRRPATAGTAVYPSRDAP